MCVCVCVCVCVCASVRVRASERACMRLAHNQLSLNPCCVRCVLAVCLIADNSLCTDAHYVCSVTLVQRPEPRERRVTNVHYYYYYYEADKPFLICLHKIGQSPPRLVRNLCYSVQ